MKKNCFFACLLLVSNVVCTGFSYAAHQTLSYSQGYVYKNKNDIKYNHGAWSVDYRGYFNDYFNGQISYYNEGHLGNNKRDGIILSLGPALPIAKNFTFSINAGGYFYANTLINGTNFEDTHGMAPSLEAGIDFYYKMMLINFKVRKIFPSQSYKGTISYLMGIGLNFENNAFDTTERNNHINFYYGAAILNSISDPKSWAGEARYDYDVTEHVKLSANILTENLSPEKRVGKGVQAFIYTHLTKNLTAALGVGPEYISNAKRKLNALITMNVDYVIPKTHFSIQAIWNRVSTFGNRDTDDFMAGIGYAF